MTRCGRDEYTAVMMATPRADCSVSCEPGPARTEQPRARDAPARVILGPRGVPGERGRAPRGARSHLGAATSPAGTLAAADRGGRASRPLGCPRATSAAPVVRPGRRVTCAPVAAPGKSVVFDVIGTLFSLDRLRAELRELHAPDGALELWFGQSLRDFFAVSHAGGYVPLEQVLEAALPRALATLDVDVDAGRAGQVVAAMAELELAPGGREATAALRDAGCALVALSNGSLEATTGLLRRAGLLDAFAAVRSCDEIAVSKPAPAAYALARERADGELWMVAAHAWDIAGAARAGLRTAWVSAVEGEYLAAYPPPDVVAGDLAEAAAALLAR